MRLSLKSYEVFRTVTTLSSMPTINLSIPLALTQVELKVLPPVSSLSSPAFLNVNLISVVRIRKMQVRVITSLKKVVKIRSKLRIAVRIRTTRLVVPVLSAASRPAADRATTRTTATLSTPSCARSATATKVLTQIEASRSRRPASRRSSQLWRV